MKTWFLCVRLLLVVAVFIAMLVNATIIMADVDQFVDPGSGESNWSTPWAPGNVIGTPGFIDFEGMSDSQTLGEVIPGVKFVNTGGQDWLVSNILTGNYNGKYPNGQYTLQGNCCAWLGPTQGQGKIIFTQGKATYFSCLTSTFSGITVDAYDENDNFIVSSGMCASNLDTGEMSRLTVISPYRNIQYVIVHDTGNLWIIDCISTDAPGVDLLLKVKDFKQTSWASDLIPGQHWDKNKGKLVDNTIGSVGCALTSLADVLYSYGFTTIDVGDPGTPDIQPLDPGTLNIWLKNNMGYTAEGDIDWTKTKKLTSNQLVFAGGVDRIPVNSNDYKTVNKALENRQPVILGVRGTQERDKNGNLFVGHYVVASGKHTLDVNDESKNYYYISDPGWSNHNSLHNDYYNDNWYGYRLYKPGDGVIRPELTIRMHSPAEIMITDRYGKRIGYDNASGTILQEIPGASIFEDGPITDLETGEIAIPSHKEIYLPDADSGPYQLTIFGTGTGGYKLDVESCDSSMQYYTVTQDGTTSPGKTEFFLISNSTTDATDLVITPIEPIKTGPQTWQLDSETKLGPPPTVGPDNRVVLPAGYFEMEKTKGPDDDGQSGQVNFTSGQTIVWIADQVAQTDVTFTSGGWKVELITDSDWGVGGDQCTVAIGYWDGIFNPLATYTKISDYDVDFAGNKTIFKLNKQLSSIKIPVGTYLALEVTDDDGDHIVYTGEGDLASCLTSPQTDPGYPLPELASAILFGLGLSGLAVYIVIRRKKAQAVRQTTTA
jgi:hypothetical protein